MPFGKELVIGEGEFKACALHEAGIRAVGVGGFSSAMCEGALISGLAKVLSKWPPETLYFLGDNDTALNFAFSVEATKLRKLLPATCRLMLPRIPLDEPKEGIDDCRRKYSVRNSPAFWQQIIAESIPVEPKLPAAAFAVKLATRELGAIAKLENKDVSINQLAELASFLDPISLESLASAARETLHLPVAAFRETAKQIAAERKADAAAKSRAASAQTQEPDVAEILNDPRLKLEIPGVATV